jgi:phosphatidate cytidylyltransferase
MHLNRWLTSLLLLPVIIFLIIRGGAPFFILIGAVCVVSLWEYFSIIFHGRPKNKVMIHAGLVLGFFMVLAAHQGSVAGLLWLLSLDLLVCAVASIAMSKPQTSLIESVPRQIHGMIYIPLFLSLLVLLRNQGNGASWILMILCVIFAGDTGAFYVGTYLGRHKLIPWISPGKTIEGAVGGVAANIAVGSLINYFFPLLPWGMSMQTLPWGLSIAFFVAIGLVGQLGDLYESQFKRAADIKDSGNILPGHGGILDRIDALLFAAPAAYFFKMMVF